MLVPIIPKEDFCGSERDDMPLKREGEMILSTLMLLTHLHLQCLLFVCNAGHRLLTAVVCPGVLTFDPVGADISNIACTWDDLFPVDYNNSGTATTAVTALILTITAINTTATIITDAYHSWVRV